MKFCEKIVFKNNENILDTEPLCRYCLTVYGAQVKLKSCERQDNIEHFCRFLPLYVEVDNFHIIFYKCNFCNLCSTVDAASLCLGFEGAASFCPGNGCSLIITNQGIKACKHYLRRQVMKESSNCVIVEDSCINCKRNIPEKVLSVISKRKIQLLCSRVAYTYLQDFIDALNGK